MKNIIDNQLLKILDDKASIKTSNKIRSSRNRLIRAFKQKASSFVAYARNRFTHTCNHTENLPGQLLLTENSGETDNLEAIIVHKNIGVAYDFLNKILKVNSVDNKGMALVSSVNYSKDYENAFWNGQMVYGDGAKYFKPLGRALDVTVHELGHGVTEKIGPNLFYYFDAGALNEAFSDILGVSCKHWVNDQLDPNTANWLMGDEIVTEAFPGKAIRSFKNEKAYTGDTQPKFKKDKKFTVEDNGGVHINSGIINHLFYRTCMAFKSPSFGDPLQLFWSTHKKLSKYSNFSDFKKKLILSAEELFGKGTLKYNLVLETVKEVGF